MTTVLLYKPYGVVSDEPESLRAYVTAPGLIVAGRLDRDSEGLLVLTDNGDLAHRLTHPQYEHPKTYLVQVEGTAADAALEPLRRGVIVRGERTRPAEVHIVPPPDLPPRSAPVRADVPTTWLEITLREGKKRQIRHMTAAAGFPTLRLVRIAIGPLALGGLRPGHWRALDRAEEQHLRDDLLAVPGRHATRRRSPPRRTTH